MMNHDVKCDEVRERTLDILRAGGDPRRDEVLARHLASCRTCTYETDAAVSAWRALDGFETESAAAHPVAARRMPDIPWRARSITVVLAALGLVLAGFVGGFGAGRMDTGRDVAQLRDELYRTQDVLMANLMNLDSASAQLGALNTVRDAGGLDPRLLQALGSLVQEADNPNVRIAALEMLLSYAEQPPAARSLAEIRAECDPLLCALLDHWQGSGAL